MSLTLNGPVKDLKFQAPEKYQRNSLLGAGGMKVVLSSMDTQTGREVAIAVAKDSTGKRRDKFIEEARITAALEHPNIVPVHEIGVSMDGVPYFSMKMIHGKTLSDILRSLENKDPEYLRKYPLETLLDIFLKVCNAISFAHSKGIVHLDLKPDNVEVGDFGEVLVLDWGLARHIEEIGNPASGLGAQTKSGTQTLAQMQENDGRTVDGMIKGTPEYMAPEQALGLNSHRSTLTDIYSLGAILYALLTFHSPVDGINNAAIIRNVAEGRIIPPRERCPEDRRIPVALQFMVYKALSHNPQNRYQSVKELIDDVVAYRNGYPTVAEEAGVFTRLSLYLKRKRSQLFLTASISFTCFLLISFCITRVYYKKLELNIYEISERARIDAEKRQSVLEKRMQRESFRKWRTISQAFFTNGPGGFSGWSIQNKTKPFMPADKNWSKEGLLLDTDDTVISLYPEKTIPGADLRFIMNLQVKDLSELGRICICPDSADSDYAPVFEIRTGHFGCIQMLSSNQNRMISGKSLLFVPGHFYRVMAELLPGKIGEPCVLNFYVNDKLIVSGRDRWPLGPSSKRKPVIRISDLKVSLSSITVQTLGIPIKSDVLALADRMMNYGLNSAAEQLYVEAEASAGTPERMAIAGKGVLVSRLIAENERKLPEWRAFLSKKWPGSSIRLIPSGTGLALFCSGGKDIDMSVLHGIPVAELNLADCTLRNFAEIRLLPLQILSLQRTRTQDISGLSGLKLQAFESIGNPLKSITPLLSMPLNSLVVRGAALETLPSLSGLPLKYLDLGYNRLRDTLAIAVPTLKTLCINDNQIQSLEPLNGLFLTEFQCSGNQIRTIQPINFSRMQMFAAARNQLTDISPLGKAENLQYLKIDGNQIESLEPVRHSRKLKDLFASGNRISRIPELSGLRNLRRLELAGNRISSLKGFRCPEYLTILNIAGNSIEDLTPLSRAFPLRSLNCSENPIRSLAPLDSLNLDILQAADLDKIESFGQLFDFPPYRLFIVDNGHTTETLRKKYTAWAAVSRDDGRFRLSFRILEAFYRGDRSLLQKASVRIGNHRYTFIPLLVNAFEAQNYAKQAGAALPAFSTMRELYQFQRFLSVPAWVQYRTQIELCRETKWSGEGPDPYYSKKGKHQLVLQWTE